MHIHLHIHSALIIYIQVLHTCMYMVLMYVHAGSTQREYGSQWCYTESGYWVNLDEGQNTWRISNNNKLTHFFTKPELDRCFFEK